MLTVPAQLGVLAEVHTKTGRFDEAARALDVALRLAQKHENHTYEAELHRLKGALALGGSNDEKDAEEHFKHAIDFARTQKSRAWELRATVSLARLWQSQGRCDEARAALSTVYGAYTEGFTTPDLVDAGTLLKELS
jgi:tetratricopeptide (TPR) repeat protein